MSEWNVYDKLSEGKHNNNKMINVEQSQPLPCYSLGITWYNLFKMRRKLTWIFLGIFELIDAAKKKEQNVLL